MRLQIPPTRALGLLAALTVVIVSMSTALLVWEMRKRDLERERLDTASVAHMLREETERNFEASDGALRAVQERMETDFGKSAPLDGAVVKLLLGARAISAPQVDVIAITNGQGRVVNASRDDPRLAVSVDQSAYFKAFSAGTAAGLFIDKPVRIGPAEWAIDMARAITGPGGKLRGVVVLTLRAPNLEEFQQRMDPEHARPIAVYLDDGTLVASAPRNGFVGERPPELGSGPINVTGDQVRSLAHRTGDGRQRFFALAHAGSLPLLVGVGSDDEMVLAQWREQAFSIVLGALLVCLFTVTAAVVMAGELRREARLAQALRDANDRYHRTVESLMDAIVSIDAGGAITLFNPAAERMFGIAATDALGASFERLVPPRSRVAHAGYMRHFAETQLATGGMQLNADVAGLRADGSEFPLETSLTRTFVDGHPEIIAVLRDVTERRRAERELHEINRQLRALSSSLQDVREQERSRIAAELHDELGQQLTGLKLELSWLGNRVKEGRTPRIEEIDAMRRQLDGTIGSVRRIATELRPRVLDDLGFCAALAWQAKEFARRSGLELELDLAASECITQDPIATGLFRIVQESLTNVARHSGARHVLVQLQLQPTDDAVLLRVKDDGAGFDTSNQARAGIGLVSMRERATALGGHLRVESAFGAGTTVEVVVPLASHVAEEAEEAAA
ncbi:MAG TPA: PAS domain S-box protein [Ramlibacter sp.]